MNYGLIQLELDIPIPRRGICIVQNPQHPLSPAAKALLDMLIHQERGPEVESLEEYPQGNRLAY